jgi:hypothetical protein
MKNAAKRALALMLTMLMIAISCASGIPGVFAASVDGLLAVNTTSVELSGSENRFSLDLSVKSTADPYAVVQFHIALDSGIEMSNISYNPDLIPNENVKAEIGPRIDRSGRATYLTGLSADGNIYSTANRLCTVEFTLTGNGPASITLYEASVARMNDNLLIPPITEEYSDNPNTINITVRRVGSETPGNNNTGNNNPSGGGGGGGGLSGPTSEPSANAPAITANAIGTTGGALTNPRVHPFTDIRGHWAENSIAGLYFAGVVGGVSPTAFEPERSITRAEVLKIVMEAFALTSGAATVSFPDVEANRWYYAYVCKGSELGVIRGYEDGTFRPNQSITRQELCVVVSRAMESAGKRLTAVDARADFIDNSEISAYAADAVYALQQAGVISGYEDGSFRPARPITRAETAKIVYTIMQS